jgi:hypothetical protein
MEDIQDESSLHPRSAALVPPFIVQLLRPSWQDQGIQAQHSVAQHASARHRMVLYRFGASGGAHRGS